MEYSPLSTSSALSTPSIHKLVLYSMILIFCVYVEGSLFSEDFSSFSCSYWQHFLSLPGNVDFAAITYGSNKKCNSHTSIAVWISSSLVCTPANTKTLWRERERVHPPMILVMTNPFLVKLCVHFLYLASPSHGYGIVFGELYPVTVRQSQPTMNSLTVLAVIWRPV